MGIKKTILSAMLLCGVVLSGKINAAGGPPPAPPLPLTLDQLGRAIASVEPGTEEAQKFVASSMDALSALLGITLNGKPQQLTNPTYQKLLNLPKVNAAIPAAPPVPALGAAAAKPVGGGMPGDLLAGIQAGINLKKVGTKQPQSSDADTKVDHSGPQTGGDMASMVAQIAREREARLKAKLAQQQNSSSSDSDTQDWSEPNTATTTAPKQPVLRPTKPKVSPVATTTKVTPYSQYIEIIRQLASQQINRGIFSFKFNQLKAKINSNSASSNDFQKLTAKDFTDPELKQQFIAAKEAYEKAKQRGGSTVPVAAPAKSVPPKPSLSGKKFYQSFFNPESGSQPTKPQRKVGSLNPESGKHLRDMVEDRIGQLSPVVTAAAASTTGTLADVDNLVNHAGPQVVDDNAQDFNFTGGDDADAGGSDTSTTPPSLPSDDELQIDDAAVAAAAAAAAKGARIAELEALLKAERDSEQAAQLQAEQQAKEALEAAEKQAQAKEEAIASELNTFLGPLMKIEFDDQRILDAARFVAAQDAVSLTNLLIKNEVDALSALPIANRLISLSKEDQLNLEQLKVLKNSMRQGSAAAASAASAEEVPEGYLADARAPIEKVRAALTAYFASNSAGINNALEEYYISNNKEQLNNALGMVLNVNSKGYVQKDIDAIVAAAVDARALYIK